MTTAADRKGDQLVRISSIMAELAHLQLGIADGYVLAQFDIAVKALANAKQEIFQQMRSLP